MRPLCETHDWKPVDAMAVQELRRDGYPSGYYKVAESTFCPTCNTRGSRYVRGVRARTASQAMGLYRTQEKA